MAPPERDRTAICSAVCTVARCARLLGAAQVGAPPALSSCTWRSWREIPAARPAPAAERIERHAHLARHAAHAAPRRPHGQQAARELVVDEPGQRLVVQLVRGNGEGQDGLGGQLLACTRVAQIRQVAAHARDGRAHVVHASCTVFQLVLGGDGGQPSVSVVDVLERRGGDGVLDLARHVDSSCPAPRRAAPP
jgi:hypothetical protein